MSKLCSCIVPCFNEEEVIPLYYEEMQKVRKQEEGKIDFEIIFIDDGSKDKTWEIIKQLAKVGMNKTTAEKYHRKYKGSVKRIMKKIISFFLGADQVYFTYGNPVKAEFYGLSARP